jgi:hypothetical protein
MGIHPIEFDNRPFRVTGFAESYSAANEWCASRGAARDSRALAMRISVLAFIDVSPKFDWQFRLLAD